MNKVGEMTADVSTAYPRATSSARSLTTGMMNNTVVAVVVTVTVTVVVTVAVTVTNGGSDMFESLSTVPVL